MDLLTLVCADIAISFLLPCPALTPPTSTSSRAVRQRRPGHRGPRSLRANPETTRAGCIERSRRVGIIQSSARAAVAEKGEGDAPPGADIGGMGRLGSGMREGGGCCCARTRARAGLPHLAPSALRGVGLVGGGWAGSPDRGGSHSFFKFHLRLLNSCHFTSFPACTCKPRYTNAVPGRGGRWSRHWVCGLWVELAGVSHPLFLNPDVILP